MMNDQCNNMIVEEGEEMEKERIEDDDVGVGVGIDVGWRSINDRPNHHQQHHHNNHHNYMNDDDDNQNHMKDQRNNNSCKTKNYPYFTIILRQKLPILMTTTKNNDETNKMTTTTTTLTNRNNDDACCEKNKVKNLSLTDENDDEKGEQNKQRSIHNSLDDFEFTTAWQIWLLNDSNEHFSGDWNVKKYGSASKMARKFWSTYTELQCLPTNENPLSTVMIFRESIEPKWEDKCNAGGGRWFFDINYNSPSSLSSSSLSSSVLNYHHQQLSQQHQQQSINQQQENFFISKNFWTECLQLIMSGSLDQYDDHIVGMILNLKPSKYRISLWIRSSTNFDQIIELGKQLRKRLNLQCQIKYELHTENDVNNNNNNNGVGSMASNSISTTTTTPAMYSVDCINNNNDNNNSTMNDIINNKNQT
uniref:Probable cyclin-dependent serine/threonine-protein kinase DDB_G0292550 n=1 Tax=Dermatophagoides pteronyssinus TaxID=6956 RepID=A0A6P6YG58_DERPT|nr:probable cyclin-dependent serine/threonine-protein kinase DDB_G0292550 [Dermatophagoides pteronyssinus]